MTLMDLSLAILAVCTLVQLGFFLFDRWRAYRFTKHLLSLPAPKPSRSSYTGNPAFDFLLIMVGAYALGWLLGKLIRRLQYELGY